ncbi:MULTISPECIES: hypothetical protein [Niastella]|uniref:Aromatic hydrocarbon degradation protein n=1 Tax=Niastella soli TaxID=2821487 RepID=A0ABS3YWE8_9BACT|nr:hypothetical protein [Niastella soli]MBO9201837.1 hypothetical protein [Niastella soli]
MKYTLSIAILTLIGTQAFSQVPEDVIRLNWNPVSGTARSQAIGGAIGSLGGEITNNFVNPAGLGFYKLSEIVLTPGFTLGHTESNYRGSDARSNNINRFNVSTTGFVSANSDPGMNWVSKAFSIAINRSANFNNTIYYKGNNDHSSYSEQFAEEFSRSGVPFSDVRYSPYLSLGTKEAIYTYLIDTATTQNGLEVVGRPEYLNSVNQQNQIDTKGGIIEIAISYAANLRDKFYIGGSIGIPILSYERTSTFLESDPNKDVTNNFGYSRFEEKSSINGVGFNAKFGVIFKPEQQTRIGISFNTPTVYGLKERYTAKMVTDLENLFAPNYPGVDSIDQSYYGQDPEYKYDMSSPWKFLLSGSHVFNAVEDVTQQRGFISADIEYVTYGSSKFSPADQGDDQSYYDDVNKVVKGMYKGAFNFRVGGEMKFNTFMTRLGFAHYGNPYENSPVSSGKTLLSGGVGYRNSGIFLDLTYVYTLTHDAHFPYLLPAPKSNVYADYKSKIGQILVTIGFKL